MDLSLRMQILKASCANLSNLGTIGAVQMDIRRQKIGAFTGLLAPILAFACILTAIASYPQFSWSNNALSDLGVVKGLTGSLFNFGIYASGLLALAFAVLGLFVYLGKNWTGKIGSVIFAAAAVALICIGIFNERFSGTHYYFSVAFFVLVPISLFIITCSFLLASQARMAMFTLTAGIIAVLPWILLFAFHYVPDVAIPETVSALAISVWTITLSYKMIKQA